MAKAKKTTKKTTKSKTAKQTKKKSQAKKPSKTVKAKAPSKKKTEAEKRAVTTKPKTKAAQRSKSKKSERFSAPGISRTKPLAGFGVRTQGKGMSVEDIARTMPAEPDVRNAKFVSPITSADGKQYPRFGRYKGHKAMYFKTLTRDGAKDSPRVHTQLLFARDPDYDGKLMDCPKVIFSCDCERWKFRWEYAMWRRGAAEIRFGNGEPPTVTNPRLVPAACKHFVAVRKKLRQLKK